MNKKIIGKLYGLNVKQCRILKGFDFDINDIVIIKSNKKIGKIIGLFIGKFKNEEYCVEYTDNNKLIVDRYMKSDEILLKTK